MQVQNNCPACPNGQILEAGSYRKFSTLACDECGHMLLVRSSSPDQSDDYIVATNAAVTQTLKATRDKEFDLAINLVKQHVPKGSWLDVGCSYGWFMRRINCRGYEPFGLEPSPTAFSLAEKAFPGKVLNSEFPSGLRDATRFPNDYQVLSAMDVLEHIKDPSEFLDAAYTLTRQGVLLIKVPCSDGPLFRLASAFSSRRRHGLLKRLWQVNFSYPHWHYYSRRSIKHLLEQNGFSVIAECATPLFFFSTAHDRVRNIDGKPEPLLGHAIKTLAAYGIICLSYLLQRFDNIIVLAQPTSAKGSAKD